MKTAKDRRAYNRKYYRKNMEKAKSYQRAYHLAHKKNVSGRGKKTLPQTNLLKEHHCYTLSDLMNLSGDAFIRTCQTILNGEKRIVGCRH